MKIPIPTQLLCCYTQSLPNVDQISARECSLRNNYPTPSSIPIPYPLQKVPAPPRPARLYPRPYPDSTIRTLPFHHSHPSIPPFAPFHSPIRTLPFIHSHPSIPPSAPFHSTIRTLPFPNSHPSIPPFAHFHSTIRTPSSPAQQ